MQENFSSTIRVELREGDLLYAQVEFAKNSGNDCLLDQDQIPMVHIAEDRGKIYAEGFGHQDVQINGKILRSRIRLQSGDVLEVPFARLDVLVRGEDPEKTASWKRRLLTGFLVLILSGGLVWAVTRGYFFQSTDSSEAPLPAPTPEILPPPPPSTPDPVPTPEPTAEPTPASTPVVRLFRETEPVRAPENPPPRDDVDPDKELIRLDLGVPLGCVAVSPGGRIIAAGAGDGSVRLLDSISGQEIRTLKGHTDSVSCAAFSSNGKHLLTGSYDGTLRWWDVESGNEIHTLRGHTGPVRCAALSTDGTRALSGGVEGSVLYWDMETGTEKNWFLGHIGMVNSVVFTPDGRRGISGGVDATVRIWDLATGKETRRFTEDLTGVNAVAVSPDGKILLSGADGFRPGPSDVQMLEVRTLRQWDPVRGTEIILPLETHEWITFLRFSSDGKRVAVTTGGDPSTNGKRPDVTPALRLYRVSDWKEIAVWDGHTDVVSGAAFFPDNQRVVSVGLDGTLRVWVCPQ